MKCDDLCFWLVYKIFKFGLFFLICFFIMLDFIIIIMFVLNGIVGKLIFKIKKKF